MQAIMWSFKKVLELIKNAKENVITIDKLTKIIAGDTSLIPGNNKNFVMMMEPNYRVVFSYEEQQNGICRHLSISSSNNSRMHPDILNQICKEFGFINDYTKCIVYISTDGKNSLNIIEPLDGNFAPFKKD